MTAARIATVAGLLALGVVLAPPPHAVADFGPIQLASKSATEQADEAVAPALSADGRYLAFQGTIGGLEGVFRKDLQSGAVVPVAAGSVYEEEASGTDATAPSISADGRYVSFTTRTPLDPTDDTEPGSSDVYVADMATSPPTYELASALNGSPEGLIYTGSGGSLASGRVALSADGRKVVFVTTAASNLGGTAGGTPAGQVVLRDLDTRETTLVSVQRNPGTGEMEPGVPVPGGAMIEKPSLPLLRGAALSADGTTVAWLGTHLPAQVPLLSDEAQAISEEDGGELPYDEPLWRRVADGPKAPTRRIVGDGDPLAPGCPPEGSLADPACQGPFPGIAGKNPELNAAMGWLGVPKVDGVPQLSADGRIVALIGNPTEATNVFLVDMGEGLSRRQAVRQLTRQASVNPADEASVVNREPYVPLNGHIFDLAISPDGQRIALATGRQQFPLAPPNLISSPPAQLGLVELYLLNLEGETLQRVTHGDGGPGEASLASTGRAVDGVGATSPSFGAGDRLTAFASTASNLVEGDGNNASDAFVVEDDEAPRAEGRVSISAPPPGVTAKRRRRLALSAFSMPDGSVRLVAVVPGAGTLRAAAGAALGVGARPRPLTAARARAKEGGPVAMTLALPRRYRRLAHSREGLYATARVSFHAATGKPLHGELEVRFRAHRPKHGGKR